MITVGIFLSFIPSFNSVSFVLLSLSQYFWWFDYFRPSEIVKFCFWLLVSGFGALEISLSCSFERLLYITNLIRQDPRVQILICDWNWQAGGVICFASFTVRNRYFAERREKRKAGKQAYWTQKWVDKPRSRWDLLILMSTYLMDCCWDGRNSATRFWELNFFSTCRAVWTPRFPFLCRLFLLYKKHSLVYQTNRVSGMIPVPPWKFLGRSAAKGTGMVGLVMAFCIGCVRMRALALIFPFRLWWFLLLIRNVGRGREERGYIWEW